jgi:hypothetical protein
MLVEASSLQHPAEGLGRVSPPLSVVLSVSVVIPVMNDAKNLPRRFDRMKDGAPVPRVVPSERFRSISAVPVNPRPAPW